jgi:hypothetical protein
MCAPVQMAEASGFFEELGNKASKLNQHLIAKPNIDHR